MGFSGTRVFALLLAAGLLPVALSGCGKDEPVDTDTPTAERLSLIPAPASVQRNDGEFIVDAATPLLARGEAARTVAAQFAGFVSKARGIDLKISDAADDDASGIVFAIDSGMAAASPEAYMLEVSPERIQMTAADARGLFYGAVTLWQLLTGNDDDRISVPALRIDDAPRFAWRGFMLDSARHFQSVDEIKQMLDAMALHKLNTFHWHLTDDQGWRIEIKRYPRLTEVGGCRIPAGDAGRDPATGKPVPYCGYYTQDQIREVVEYAAQRHITIVPEIDVPGHAQAAVAAYPELGVTGKPIHVLNEWGVNTTLFNVEESTFVFLENVLAEVVELFPGPYVHVGGDEAVKDQWQASARVQQRMRELGAKDEMAMQSHLIKRLEKFLAAHDRRLIGWDEILEGGLPPEATVMSWRGIEGGLEAARQGHDVVMSPSSETYLDYLQTDSPNEPPGRPATIPLEQIYAFEPVPTELEDSQRHHILGLQANMWTEHTRNFQRLQHNVFPRLAAVAETGWTPQAGKDYPDFLARLPAQLHRYSAMGIGYAKTPFEVGIAIDDDRKAGTAQVMLSNPLGYEVRYSTDGSQPVAASPVYRSPFDVKLPVQVRAATFFEGKPLGDTSEFRIDAASLLRRSDEQLAVCPDTGRLLLRLEDDGPAQGERAIFNVTIFYPCWQWNGADLDGISAVNVRAGRIPYYFQLAHDEPSRTFEPAKTAHGELEIRANGCHGKVLNSVTLPAAPDADGFINLTASLPEGITGKQDLCVLFTGDTRPDMWVLDEVALQP
ncbi:family 20 glycosylhydrolase [Pseudoxanthomonas wuyuanensis]|uniref:beta-N-acetylhexosaminidase n=1 Tax=Pseudoxanthomonas wuyuanensis TaxID=1073196 RepID=A0A286DA15_9GAMM|nr:family 20 glycosylhydrolase [Pseudoxanthomonas wuyuanensis]KAF1720502.1 beta-hexosaminidase [Pseudoxanthomonas wuyuanensis]SOD55488.1 hexosaminidase [Pseudoxanthomonas wuyuanensis]